MCSNGVSSNIGTEKVCQNAATNLNKKYYTNVSDSNVKGGCIMFGDSEVFFNKTGGESVSKWGEKSICQS